jgi:hypothetical protein
VVFDYEVIGAGVAFSSEFFPGVYKIVEVLDEVKEIPGVELEGVTIPGGVEFGAKPSVFLHELHNFLVNADEMDVLCAAVEGPFEMGVR